MGLRGFRIFLNGGVFLGADDAEFTEEGTSCYTYQTDTSKKTNQEKKLKFRK